MQGNIPKFSVVNVCLSKCVSRLKFRRPSPSRNMKENPDSKGHSTLSQQPHFKLRFIGDSNQSSQLESITDRSRTLNTGRPSISGTVFCWHNCEMFCQPVVCYCIYPTAQLDSLNVLLLWQQNVIQWGEDWWGLRRHLVVVRVGAKWSKILTIIRVTKSDSNLSKF